MNAISKGIRLKTGVDYFAKGFTPAQLNEAFYRLNADSKLGALLLECATFQEIDDEYNPGEEERLSTVEMIMEAVRVKAFSRTAQTMAALARAMNKQLNAAGTGFTIGEAIIGKPKKSGLFATVTVQLPVSDGQVISIIFHSPDNNKMKITASDEILAFRWLLNKRDITAAVSPDGAEADTLPGMDAAQDVSLEDVGKRCAMLIEKNAARFASTQKEIVEAKKALEDLKAQADTETLANQQALADLKAEQDAAAQADIDIKAAQDKLAKLNDFNAKLQAQIDALAAADAGNKGKAGGEGQKTAEEIKAEQDSAEFEDKKAAFENELIGRGFEIEAAGSGFNAVYNVDGAPYLQLNISAEESGGFKSYGINAGTVKDGAKSFKALNKAGVVKQMAPALAWIDKKLGEMKKEPEVTIDYTTPEGYAQISGNKELELKYQDVLDSSFTGRIVDLRDALVSSGWTKSDSDGALYKGNTGVNFDFKYAGSGKNVVGMKAVMFDRTTNMDLQNDLKDDLSRTPEAMAAAIDAIATARQEVAPPKVDGATSPAITTLNDILAGKYSTSDEIMTLIEQAAADLEAAGLVNADGTGEQDSLLGAAADYLTAIMDREAA